MFIAASLTGSQVALLFAGAIVCVVIGGIVMHWVQRSKQAVAERELAAAKAAAEAEALKILAQAEAQAKTEFIKQREQFDKETETTRKELRNEEKRVAKREDLIDQKLETVHSKERMLDAGEKALAEREKALANKDRQLNDLIAQQKTQLLKVANLSMDEAKEILLKRVEKDMENEVSELIERRLEEARETAEEQAREIVVSSIQRYAAEHTSDRTVSTVDIPSDDMKGRVIGREGRNIRAFEKATGVDVIVDDTPGVVVVSAFDPVRREVARRSLEKLIQDGRIHPTRIEEVVAAMEQEVNKQVYEHGKQAMVEANVRGLHNKLIGTIGRLHFRTSYGQNVLRHSIEVAYLTQLMGGHPQIGADLCKRYGEKDNIINAVAGFFNDTATTEIYTPIISAADAISASRPGARRETLERYLQRLKKLEEIATSFEGVDLAYAIQAGREVRVIVDASNVDDRLSAKIARDIARRVEDEMEYPGEVKVTLVREVRCIEYAK
jgi:ribonuclease Y